MNHSSPQDEDKADKKLLVGKRLLQKDALQYERTVDDRCLHSYVRHAIRMYNHESTQQQKQISAK